MEWFYDCHLWETDQCNTWYVIIRQGNLKWKQPKPTSLFPNWQGQKMFTQLLRLLWKKCQPSVSALKLDLHFPSHQREKAAGSMRVFSAANLFVDSLLLWTPTKAFSESTRASAFHFGKSNWRSVVFYRNGYPMAGTLVVTENDKEVQLISLEAWASGHHGHVITFSEFVNPYLIDFSFYRDTAIFGKLLVLWADKCIKIRKGTFPNSVSVYY